MSPEQTSMRTKWLKHIAIELFRSISETRVWEFSQNENAANANTQKDHMQNMQPTGFIVIGLKALYEPHDNYQRERLESVYVFLLIYYPFRSLFWESK